MQRAAAMARMDLVRERPQVGRAMPTPLARRSRPRRRIRHSSSRPGVLEAHPGDVADVILDVAAPRAARARRRAPAYGASARRGQSFGEPGEGLLEELLRLRAEDEQSPVEHERGVTALAPSRRGLPLSTPRRARGSGRRRAPRRRRRRRQISSSATARNTSRSPMFLPRSSRRPSAGRAPLVPPELPRELGQPERVHRVRDDLGVRIVLEPARGEERSSPRHAGGRSERAGVPAATPRADTPDADRTGASDLGAEPALDPAAVGWLARQNGQM